MDELCTSYPDLSKSLQNYVLNSPAVCGGCYGVLTNFTDEPFIDKVNAEKACPSVPQYQN